MTQTFNQTKSVNNPNGTTTKKANQKTKNNERKIKKKIKEGERDMKKEKKIALITLLVMILNMFSPYSVLFNNISKAATGVLGDNPIIINNLGVTQKGYKQNPNSRNCCSNRSSPKWI